MIAPVDQIDARQTYEFLQMNAAQVVVPQLTIFLAPRVLHYNNIAFISYVANPERLHQITRFGDYVTISLAFTEASQPLPHNVTADQQLVAALQAILNMIDL